MPTENTTQSEFVGEVGRLFWSWNSDDGQECLEHDLAEKGPEEMARGFKQAELLLKGLALHGEEALSYGAVLILYDAIDLSRRARRTAERYIKEESH